MNSISAILDIPSGEIFDRDYDLALFASGHEKRAGHVASLLKRDRILDQGVFGFASDAAEPSRILNDEMYRRLWGTEPMIMSNRAEEQIYTFLASKLSKISRPKLLVDYSSMTRFWYASLINWLRFCECCERVEVDFVYCQATYEGDIPPLRIDEILSIPGCEGNTASAGPSVALLGLGFDSNSVQCVLDDLEPDIVKAFIAAGAARPDYVDHVRKSNSELLQRCGDVVELPLESVATTVTCLSEIVAPYGARFNVSMIPLGPKPHVLASIILSMKLPHVAALHVSGRRIPPWDALPTGSFICTRLVFSRSVQPS